MLKVYWCIFASFMSLLPVVGEITMKIDHASPRILVSERFTYFIYLEWCSWLFHVELLLSWKETKVFIANPSLNLPFLEKNLTRLFIPWRSMGSVSKDSVGRQWFFNRDDTIMTRHEKIQLRISKIISWVVWNFSS